MRVYKEDSTRGRAVVRPRNYKGDTLVQAWIDRRKLAVISQWLDEGGYRTRFLSDLVKLTIDEVVAELVERGIVEMIEFTDSATKILEMKYRADLNPGKRGMRNLHHNMVLDKLRSGERLVDDIEREGSDSSIVQEARKLADEGVAIYNKKYSSQTMQKDPNQYDKDGIVIKRSTIPAKNNFVDVSEAEARAKGNDEKLKDMP